MIEKVACYNEMLTFFVFVIDVFAIPKLRVRESELLGCVCLFVSYSENCRLGRNGFVIEFYG